MKYKIGVIGKAARSKEVPKILEKGARLVGEEIARQGVILVTGACMGVPEIAAKAASKKGGLVLGYSPAKEIKEHLSPPVSYPFPVKNEILIFTGHGKIGRNVLSVLESDGVIAVGGGIGTLNEFSIAFHEGKVIGVLEGVGGAIEKVLNIEEELRKGTGKRIKAVIIKDKEPRRLVKRVLEEIKKREKKIKAEAPIVFKNKKGKNLFGVLHLPEKERPPLVILSHGFQGNVTDSKFVKLARVLREEGFLVFRFDFEGCGNSEGEAKGITLANEVFDLESAWEAVLDQCHIDSKRVAIVGYSLGAVASALFASKFETPIKTLVFWAPALNQKELFKIWYSKDDLEEIKKGVLIKGTKEIGREYYLENKNRDYSPVLSKIKSPILIIHGKKDEDVPLGFSKKLSENQNIVLKVLPKADHKFGDLRSQERLVSETAKWIKKYL